MKNKIDQRIAWLLLSVFLSCTTKIVTGTITQDGNLYHAPNDYFSIEMDIVNDYDDYFRFTKGNVSEEDYPQYYRLWYHGISPDHVLSFTIYKKKNPLHFYEKNLEKSFEKETDVYRLIHEEQWADSVRSYSLKSYILFGDSPDDITPFKKVKARMYYQVIHVFSDDYQLALDYLDVNFRDDTKKWIDHKNNYVKSVLVGLANTIKVNKQYYGFRFPQVQND